MATIMAIDDDQQIRRLVRTIITRKTGHHVLEEETGLGGVAKAIEMTPDLILLDIRLPDLDGFEVCRRIKAHPKTRRIPVIMVTVLGSKEDIINSYRSGANDYIVKPFEYNTLLFKVVSHLHGRVNADAASVEQALPAPAPEAAIAPIPPAAEPAAVIDPAATAAPSIAAAPPPPAVGTGKKSLRGQLAAKLQKRGDAL